MTYSCTTHGIYNTRWANTWCNCIESVRPDTVSPSFFLPTTYVHTFTERARRTAGGWQTKSSVTSSPRARARKVRLARTILPRERADRLLRKRCRRQVTEKVVRERRKDKRSKEEVAYVSRPKVECWPRRVISVTTTTRATAALALACRVFNLSQKAGYAQSEIWEYADSEVTKYERLRHNGLIVEWVRKVTRGERDSCYRY